MATIKARLANKVANMRRERAIFKQNPPDLSLSWFMSNNSFWSFGCGKEARTALNPDWSAV
jgi:hypothetical protein